MPNFWTISPDKPRFFKYSIACLLAGTLSC
ncbi:Uncharacterised protein [Vibrio cholerae]|nr:Uncharacterised protein [Vibrio cholerae]